MFCGQPNFKQARRDLPRRSVPARYMILHLAESRVLQRKALTVEDAPLLGLALAGRPPAVVYSLRHEENRPYQQVQALV